MSSINQNSNGLILPEAYASATIAEEPQAPPIPGEEVLGIMGKRNTKQDQSLTNKNLEIIQKLNIIDDFLFAKMCEDKAVCEEILSTILERPIHVLKNDIQYELRNAGARSVRLDCLCVDQQRILIHHLRKKEYGSKNLQTSM